MNFAYLNIDDPIGTVARRRKRLSGNLVPIRRESNASANATEHGNFEQESSNHDSQFEKLQCHVAELDEVHKNANKATGDLQEFVNAVSHDLRTPLRSVIGFSELLTQEYSDRLDENGKDYVNRIVDGAGRMQELINCITEFSRICAKEPDFVDVNLNDVMQNVLDDLHEGIEQSNAVVTWDSLPTVQGEYLQLLEVFKHLVENGIRFHGDASPTVHVSSESHETGCVFKVSDNGIGIAEKDHSNAFRMFRRIGLQDTNSIGLGAGLAICKRIIERHDGRIELKSEPGVGTEVIFSLGPKDTAQ